MKRIKFLLAFLILSMTVNAQTSVAHNEVIVGSVLKIGPATGYKHIYFPKKNFIIKKGGIVDYKRIADSKVVVTAITEGPDGTVEVSVALQNGKQFFNRYKVMKANLTNAIKAKELIVL